MSSSVAPALRRDRSAGPIDVVVVTYQSQGWIGPCLDSLLGQEGVGVVLVVDSGSTDDTASVVSEYAPLGVRLQALGVNRGFGASANRGVSATTSEFVFVANPDLMVEPECLKTLGSTIVENDRLAIVGPLVCDLDGTPYPSARSFPNLLDAVGHGFLGLIWQGNPWSRRYLRPDRVDWISGTAMLVRRSAFESVGGFDESYYMYVEDVDLSWRLKAQGWKVALDRDAVVRHAIGGSSETAPYRMIVAHHVSLWRFARRTAHGAPRALLPLVCCGLVARTLLVAARRMAVRQPPATLVGG